MASHSPEEYEVLRQIRRSTPIGRLHDDLARGGPLTDVCYLCEAPIAQNPLDGAWEDESGACGCAKEEHEPLGSRTKTREDERRELER